MGTVRDSPGMVRLLGTVTRVAVLAVADRQSISGHGGEVMVSPGSSVGDFSACGARPGTSGYDSQIS